MHADQGSDFPEQVSQEPSWLGKETFDLAFAFVNLFVPFVVVVAELVTQAAKGDDEEEEVHEYAWLGDEKHGGFKELVVDESPRLKLLRYNLEHTDLKVLTRKAADAGVATKTLQNMHSSDQPKHYIIEALMQIAGTEGSGTVGKKGPQRKPIGTVAGVFEFEQGTGQNSGPKESEFDNPTFDIEGN